MMSPLNLIGAGAHGGRAAQRGFSLIELMVGTAIGLLCVLVIATVMSATEGQRRGTTQGGDAQVSGSLALYSVQREVSMAGYGFAGEAAAVGCPLQAFYNGAVVTALPAQLAPVIITQGVLGTSDSLRVLASSKFIDGNAATRHDVGYTVPTRIVSTYDPNDTGPTKAYQYQVASLMSVSAGDLMVAVIDNVAPCGLFQATGVVDHPIQGKLVQRADDVARWNNTRHPSQVANNGAFLVNLGRLIDVVYSVDEQQRLVRGALDTSNMSRNAAPVQSNIVLMKAMYGRDSAGNDGVVDTYDYNTPIDNAGWMQVLAVRLVVVSRSAQYEKDEVTAALPQWDVGNAVPVAGAETCGGSKCVALKVDGAGDWKHYRYKVFDTIVPLRNQRWKAGGA